MTEIIEKQYLTSTEILNQYNLSRTFVLKLAREGKIFCILKGNKKLYDKESLDKFLDSCRVDNSADIC